MEKVKIWRSAIMAYIGGMLYMLIELLWRGWTHPSMFIVGGICFLILGSINEGILNWDMPLLWQGLLGALCVTGVELVAGLILNVWLRWGVWDYSKLPLNFMGQICPYYFLLWIPLSLVAVTVDDWLRHWLFGERKPEYHLLPSRRGARA